MSKPYIARGKVVPFIDAIRANPTRVWTVREACEVMNIRPGAVIAVCTYALRNEVMFRAMRYGRVVLSGTPFTDGAMPPPPAKKHESRVKTASGWETDPDDPRVPKIVQGWKPPVMVPPRAQA